VGLFKELRISASSSMRELTCGAAVGECCRRKLLKVRAGGGRRQYGWTSKVPCCRTVPTTDQAGGCPDFTQMRSQEAASPVPVATAVSR
jgi:hypothetical protein